MCVRAHGELRAYWVKMAVCPCKVPSGHLSLIFRDSPHEKIFSPVFIYIHSQIR